MRLVLCDDHRLFLEALAGALSAHGHDVLALTGTPDAAAAAVCVHQPDVCVLDLGFLGIEPQRVVRTVVAASPSTRVLVLSGSEDSEDVATALAAGATGFVANDQPVARVVEALERVRDGHRVEPPAPRQRSAPRDGAGVTRPRLTTRELEVLELVYAGADTATIASRLGISISTARSHVGAVLTKLGAHTRLQAAAMVGSGQVPELTLWR